jgi:hypothetical protein
MGTVRQVDERDSTSADEVARLTNGCDEMILESESVRSSGRITKIVIETSSHTFTSVYMLVLVERFFSRRAVKSLHLEKATSCCEFGCCW